MPLHLINANFEKIELSIPRKYVNIFLSILWDDFNSSIGRVACQHSYLKTKNSEIYEYNICWAEKDLPFVAELSFFNHTDKGLMYVLLETLDHEKRHHSANYHEKIKQSLLRCVKKEHFKHLAKPSGYLKVPIKLETPLSGNYRFELSDVLLLKTTEASSYDCHIIFPVFNTDPYELKYEGNSKSIDIASSLSVVTQNIFIIDDDIQWEFISTQKLNELVLKSVFDGQYISDDGQIFRIEFFSENGAKYLIDDPLLTKEIINTSDCIVNTKLVIPERIDIIMEIISDDARLQQSCRRFHEGLMFRHRMHVNMDSIFYVAYELISYVAAIEANLDTEIIQTNVACSSCGELTFKEERKISEKFRKFVADNSDNNPIFIKTCKDLYNDRSMFVHTGINLHSLGATRPNRPLILKGKECKSSLPQYYYNIHEYIGFILRKYLYGKLFCVIKEA